mgnify:CR=1 FL=1
MNSKSVGSNPIGGAKNTTAIITLDNSVGIDLSNLNSETETSFLATAANKLEAHETIYADGHLTINLDAKAVNITGDSDAKTFTALQKGLLVSNNSATPGSTATVIDGGSVDLKGLVDGTSIANASTMGGGDALALAVNLKFFSKYQRRSIHHTFRFHAIYRSSLILYL